MKLVKHIYNYPQSDLLGSMLDGEPLCIAPDSWGTELHCPVCGCEYTHLNGIFAQENDDYKAWSGRGDAYRIKMFCENGHEWYIRFGFHKGMVYIAVEDAKDT